MRFGLARLRILPVGFRLGGCTKLKRRKFGSFDPHRQNWYGLWPSLWSMAALLCLMDGRSHSRGWTPAGQRRSCQIWRHVRDRQLVLHKWRGDRGFMIHWFAVQMVYGLWFGSFFFLMEDGDFRCCRVSGRPIIGGDQLLYLNSLICADSLNGVVGETNECLSNFFWQNVKIELWVKNKRI